MAAVTCPACSEQPCARHWRARWSAEQQAEERARREFRKALAFLAKTLRKVRDGRYGPKRIDLTPRFTVSDEPFVRVPVKLVRVVGKDYPAWWKDERDF